MASIEDLPYELLSQILNLAADLNAQDSIQYTYGISQAPLGPLQSNVCSQKYVRGRVPSDIFKWNLVSSFRRVNSKWHEWALGYALKDVYIRRRKGGEMWLMNELPNNNCTPSDNTHPIVFQQPYKTLGSTASLFKSFPRLASHVHCIWFDSIYLFETTNLVFSILQSCVNIHTAKLPWTTLRYGEQQAWQKLMSRQRLTSLEFIAETLTSQQMERGIQIDNQVLRSHKVVDFSGLRRFKLFGDSNLNPIRDRDLFSISKSLTRLAEIHITSTTSVTIDGVAALVHASKNTLELLEFTPLSDSGFRHPSSVSVSSANTTSLRSEGPSFHICSLVASCERLKDLSITLPACCKELFSTSSLRTTQKPWRETVRVRLTGTAEPLCSLPSCTTLETTTVDKFATLLDNARTCVTEHRHAADGEDDTLNIEISVGNYLFETTKHVVHGNYTLAKKKSEMTWIPEVEYPSRKGPYGYTGLYSYRDEVVKGEWSYIGEKDFWEAVRWGLVIFGE